MMSTKTLSLFAYVAVLLISQSAAFITHPSSLTLATRNLNPLPKVRQIVNILIAVWRLRVSVCRIFPGHPTNNTCNIYTHKPTYTYIFKCLMYTETKPCTPLGRTQNSHQSSWNTKRRGRVGSRSSPALYFCWTRVFCINYIQDERK